MKILIAGATGFIGKALARALTMRGDSVIILGRSRDRIKFVFGDTFSMWTWIDLETRTDPIDVVINLAGENIAGLWTTRKKEKILNSRLAATKRLIAFCTRQKELSGTETRLLQASGIGIYGSRGDRVYDENSVLPQEDDFLSDVAHQLENTAKEAERQQIPLLIMRFGVVLDANGGMLEQLFPIFKYGFGAILGQGKQWISWISRVDLVKAILFLSLHPQINGVINLVAKEPIQQKDFAGAYAKHLKRPLFFRIPQFLLECLLGEMGKTLLLGSQRVVPHRLEELGFDYEYPNLNYYFAK